MGYFPQSDSHYIENTGSEDLVFLEVLQADSFTGRCSPPPLVFFFFFLWVMICEY